ncbi:histone-lysine N-methyltransferase family member SUVH9-like [Trifolium pratense]|uniref:histone-lysine N-methyltransferase family member SUVH9-like n=1 Tax=Trifolium pratense TaxID=57577 RepID=UPI001E69113A|nr:histone-lysine N-methyltransferase family member SUVH9-like [Trifolium pratense]
MKNNTTTVRNLNHQEQTLTNDKTTNNMHPDLHHITELFRRNFGSQRIQNEVTTQRLQGQLKELVRVSDLDLPNHQQLRAIVRRIRMTYDSVRLLAVAEEENGVVVHPERSDQRASALMRRHGLWLNRDKTIIGTIPGVCIGDVFFYKTELAVVGLHGQPEADIDYIPGSVSSSGEPIATSVIVSGGYENDVDQSNVIVYSVYGGEDKNSRQVFHQKLEGGNLAMERSMHYGIEVRVIRSVQYEGTASVFDKVYFYDGLYKIVKSWVDSKSGFNVYNFKLQRIDGQAKMDCVVFNPRCVLSLDISKKKENVDIRLVNNIDRNHDPIYFEYLPRAIFPHFVLQQSGGETGCECINNCVDGCFCFIKNGNEFPYSQNGILLKGRPFIFECGPLCRCPPHCRNRVTQKGLKHRLEVFRSRNSGWGVRSLDLIQAGTFICEYTGIVLTREQQQIVTMNGDSLIYPSQFAENWAEWGNLSLIDTSYKCPSYPSIPPLEFAMDVSRMRNVACYISHNSTPNVMVQFVHFEHNNVMFPHTMLFAIENIPPLRELTLDYGVADGDLSG